MPLLRGCSPRRRGRGREKMPLPSLFRPAAVDFQRDQMRWGEVSSLQPLSVKLTSWFLVCVIIGMIGFLVVAQYARKETATGYLTPFLSQRAGLFARSTSARGNWSRQA